MEPQWHCNTRTLAEICLSAILSSTDPTWTDLNCFWGSEPTARAIALPEIFSVFLISINRYECHNILFICVAFGSDVFIFVHPLESKDESMGLRSALPSSYILRVNPLHAELNPICYLLALLGAHHFLHVSRIRVKSLTLRPLMSYIYIYIYIYMGTVRDFRVP